MECYYKENGGSCYFHPKEVVVGVCHLCLSERLHVLAAKQGVNSHSSKLRSNYRTSSNSNNRKGSSTATKSSIVFPKIFALFSSRNSRHHLRRKSDHQTFDAADDQDSTSTSLEDESFISIKFGDNGVASWDKSSSTVSKVSLQHCSMSWGGQTSVKNATDNNKSSSKSVLMEHAKPSATSSLRWHKRIGQLLQIVRWKKCVKANAGSGGTSKVIKNDRGLIRNKD